MSETYIKLDLPLYVEVGVKKIKRIHLNYNVMRNLHFQVLNKVKKMYQTLVIEKLVELDAPRLQQIEIEYTIYKPTRRRLDIANVAFIIDKYSCDALVQYGLIKDDDYKSLKRIIIRYGGVDKENPRCEMVIKEV